MQTLKNLLGGNLRDFDESLQVCSLSDSRSDSFDMLIGQETWPLEGWSIFA